MAKNTAGSPDADSTPTVSPQDNVSLGELEPCGKHACKQLQPVKSRVRDKDRPVSMWGLASTGPTSRHCGTSSIPASQAHCSPTSISCRGTFLREVPDDLPEGFQLPMCSTWGHLLCMRVAEMSTWAGQCGTACVGQTPCLPAAASRPAAPPVLELGNCNKGLGVHPTRSASPGSHPVSIVFFCMPV